MFLIRRNKKPFMTKAYSKAIVQRTRFRTKFLKNPTDLNKVLNSKQRNYCVSLLRKKYFPKLNEKEIIDNIKFWHTVKPFLLGKVKSKESIILVNNDNIESKETEVAKTLNDFSQILLKISKFRNRSVRMTSTIDCSVFKFYKP